VAGASTGTRRQFLGAGLAGAGALAFGPGFWSSALAARRRAAASAYGPLQAADGRGLMLPEGFRSRVIARANRLVRGYPWHIFSDGQATFPTADGGWILVSNSESIALTGAGSSAIRFGPDGAIERAYRILGGTNANCAGGATPWGTWLSCEEYALGHVWECDPSGPGQGRIRPALGAFTHEAVAVDPAGRQLYMTEDRSDGALYRFTPDFYPDLSSGRLEVMVDGPGWAPVPDPSGIFTATRNQVPGTRRFDGGEGIWFDSGTVYFSTKGDNRIWAYDTAAGALTTVYEARPGTPLRGVDNLTVSRAGEIFVCEDGDDMEICVIDPDGTVAPFLRLVGDAAEGLPTRGNELAGVVFDPAGRRMYFAAQRAFGFGVVYEVSGPFRGAGAAAAPPRSDGFADVWFFSASVPRPRVRAPRRISLAKLRRRGLTVDIGFPEPAEFLVALRTDDLAREPGKRGSTVRPRTVTLDRARTRDGRVRLGLSAAEARRLRAVAPATAHVAVTAQRADGSTTVATHRLRIR
jgi:hypothetical protein